MSALAVTGLCKSFGAVQAVRDVSFALEQGEMLALIGPNGAGKSTCFNMLGGQLRPDRGSVRLRGRDVTAMPPRVVCRLGVGRTFQITASFASMTVRENVQMALLVHRRQVWRFWRAARVFHADAADALLAQVGLRDQADRAAGLLAYGDLKRLELAVALANDPTLLLMDEPTAGMAPAERTALMDLVRQLATERRLAVLFTEHDMDVVFSTADRILVLARGELIAEGDGRAIRADARVREVYLGSGATSGGTDMLDAAGINSFYGRAHILHDVSLRVAGGEVLVLLGRNGAGKSTTLKTLMGLVRPASGTIRFGGAAIAGWEPFRIARAGIGYVPEDRRVFADLTVMENLEVGRQPPRGELPEWTPERLFALFPNLGAMRERPGNRMSGGEQQMLSIARTLMGNPRLILLDEPSEGLAPVIVEQMAHAIITLKEAGVTVLLAEQNLHFALRVADSAAVIEQGRIVWAGTVGALQEDAAVREAYLAV